MIDGWMGKFDLNWSRASDWRVGEEGSVGEAEKNKNSGGKNGRVCRQILIQLVQHIHSADAARIDRS